MVYRCFIRKSIPFTHNSKRRLGWVVGVGLGDELIEWEMIMTFHIFLPPCYWSKSLKKKFLFYIFWRVEKEKKAKQREKRRTRTIFPVCACGRVREIFVRKRRKGNIRNVRGGVCGIYIHFSGGKKIVEMVEKFCDFSRPTSSPVCVCWIYVVYNIWLHTWKYVNHLMISTHCLSSTCGIRSTFSQMLTF